MNWEETKYGPALIGPTASATIKETDIGWIARIASSSLINNLATEQDAKEWAETRMNEIKKEFILSLITKEGEDIYGFGGMLNINIIGGYDNIDHWTVYGTGFNELHKGTLEECKNYIVSCF